MPYKTLMVHMDAGQANGGVLGVTAALAERYQAGVIGIAACEPIRLGYADGVLGGELAVVEQQIVDDHLKVVGADFHACDALRHRVLGWRCIPTLEPVSHIVAREARCADLIVTGISTGGLDASLHAETGDLIIRAGRPVLVVPPQPVSAEFNTVMVAWSDRRECRRAIADALPFLSDADRVIVAGVGADLPGIRAQIEDVAEWLGRHHVAADVIVATDKAGKVDRLATIAHDHAIDLIVAGAYGHNRLAEWAFGGVTRGLLLSGKHCAFLSH